MYLMNQSPNVVISSMGKSTVSSCCSPIKVSNKNHSEVEKKT